MRCVGVFLFVGLLTGWGSAVFLNHRPFPTYNLENMPETQFSCRDKILGGYYADPDAQCQMFHVCVKVAGIGIQDFRFLCPNGTAFDQDHQICAEWEDVDCDATTLYYSSDNFDLYRIGSGFESKAVKYGEDEETFALQRAETGDARLNREHQSQSINQQQQQRDAYRPQPRKQHQQQQQRNDNERDIFKTSSSSNFFNNRNNGKENDDDYDDGNYNTNQNRDYDGRRKTVRKHQRRPVQQQQQPQYQQQQNQRSQQNQQQQQNQQNQQQQSQYQQQQNQRNQQNQQQQSQYQQQQNQRSQQNQQNQQQQQQKEADTQTRRPQRPTGFVNNFAGSSYVPNTSQGAVTRGRSSQSPTPTYTISTPAPFRQYSSTENYPSQRPTTSPFAYDTSRSNKQTENYPSNNPVYSKSTSSLEKKDTKPTTFSPKAKPFSFAADTTNLPTTLAPRTNAAFSQIVQQTTNYNSNKEKVQSSFSTTTSTQKTTPFSQYTPTVPKITSTTPVSRSFRYDDGSYNPSKYDYDGGKEDEFLKTAHSQNIASSRNEYAKSLKQSTTITTTTQKPYEAPRRITENYPKSSSSRITPVPTENRQKSQPPKSGKKVKDVSYDYAYYDNFGPEPDYQIDTEIKKSTAK